MDVLICLPRTKTADLAHTEFCKCDPFHHLFVEDKPNQPPTYVLRDLIGCIELQGIGPYHLCHGEGYILCVLNVLMVRDYNIYVSWSLAHRT